MGMCEGEGDSEGRTLAPVCQKSPPLRGGWHGGAVTGEFKSKKVIFIRCFTPSVTAFGGDSSLKEGALEDGRAFFDKLRQGQSPCPTFGRGSEFMRQAYSTKNFP